jgi:hypothetical protein
MELINVFIKKNYEIFDLNVSYDFSKFDPSGPPKDALPYTLHLLSN